MSSSAQLSEMTTKMGRASLFQLLWRVYLHQFDVFCVIVVHFDGAPPWPDACRCPWVAPDLAARAPPRARILNAVAQPPQVAFQVRTILA
jgi:hypothetical protein